MSKRFTRRAHYDREVQAIWGEAESKKDLISEQQKARRQVLARQNQELIDQLRARFDSEQTD